MGLVDKPDPFEFVGRTKLKEGEGKETIASLEAQAIEEEEEAVDDPFDFVGQGGFTFTEQRSDIGLGGSFASGLGEGIAEPLTLLTGKRAHDERIDTFGEKTANFLGTLTGLGISFVPISAGTGVALRGVGLASKLSRPVFNFLRSTVAGGLQFAGTSEKVGEVPQNLGIGLAFGAAIEGFFLARAMRGRSKDVARSIDNTIDTGTPLSDVPVSPALLSQEMALAPVEAKLPARMAEEITGLRGEVKTYDEIIAGLTEIHQTTAILRGLDDVKSGGLVNFVKEALPEAQILERRALGGREVLVHNPVDPTDLITPAQRAQWDKTGFFEGLEVEFRGHSYRATGKPVAPGRVQLQSLDKPGLVFAPRVENVERAVTPRVFTESAGTAQALSDAIISTRNRIGFVLPGTEEGLVQQGFVNTEEFISTQSLGQFVRDNRDEILRFDAPTIEEATRRFAQSKGVKGLSFVDEESGLTLGHHVFDQASVTRFEQSSTMGQIVDDAIVLTGPEGEQVLQSFVPSWKNSITGALRAEGLPEKQISAALDLHAANLGRRMNNLIDDEFRAMQKESELQFFEGCF